MAEGAQAAWGPGVRSVPRLLASLPCEDAAVSFGLNDSRVSLQRVFFDLYADGFPAAFGRLVVANLWTGGEGAYRVTVRLMGPDGTEVDQAEAELKALPEPATNVQLAWFPGLVLPGPGRYAMEILLGGAVVHGYTLHAVLVDAHEQD